MTENGVVVSRRSAAFLVLILATVFLYPAPVGSVTTPTAEAQEKDPASVRARTPDFQKDILPILKTNCLRCHDSEIRAAGLDLSTQEGAFTGSASGKVIVPGKPEESRLYEMISKGLMPADRKTELSESEMETIRAWVESAREQKDPSATAQVTQLDIIPLMLLHCTACHGRRFQEGGLDLRTKAAILKGGKSGPAIVPGKPEESLMVQRIRSGEMPPQEREVEASVRKMSVRGLERLIQWIAQGAPEIEPEPSVAATRLDPLVSDQDREFWAFRPPQAAAVPSVSRVSNVPRVKNPIDAFILRKLEEKGLSLSPEADRLTLIRRACFDLTGLPPEAEDVKAFLADADENAYEALIEKLLTSPRYGERWGRYWLDLVGYADREDAHRYRDYVIRSLNADKPYDRFLLEQLAGDELVNAEKAPAVTQEIMDKLVATGFLRMARDSTGQRLINFVEHRLEVIKDEIKIFSSSILALTIGCARCHNHKFDPIPQRDYYRLTALFKGALDEHDWLPPTFADSDPNRPVLVKEVRKLPYVTPLANPLQLNEERLRREADNEKLKKEIESLKAALEPKAKPLREKLINRRLAKLPQVLHEDLLQMLATPAAKRTELQKYLAKKFEEGLKIRFGDLREIDEDYQKAAEETDKRVKLLQARILPEPQIRALWDRGMPSPTYILQRGDPTSPGRWVEPGVPSLLSDPETPLEIKPPWPGARKTGRRLALARWLTQPGHPLTARVMVNRIWKHHFERGIVKTLGNFGHTGARPTHPELLDWLALEFIHQGWSMKAMHRVIMTSSTYRQASTVTRTHEELDAENILLSRMPMRRMEAEVLRDTLFLVSGRLDETRHGPPDPVLEREDGLATSLGRENGWRRSIYITQYTSHKRGENNPTILDSFDFAQMTPNCLERVESTVAPQALHLMNDTTIRNLAGSFAERVQREASPDPLEQVQRAYWIALGRPPTSEEKEVSLKALLSLKRVAGQSSPNGEDAAKQALAKFCHTLLNSAAFIYID